MWFKQTQLFQLKEAIRYLPKDFDEKFQAYPYQECLPSMPYSSGWVSPLDEEDAPLVLGINGYMMLCLQIEEKILPAIVIRQELVKQIKKIELQENRRVGHDEKLSLKDDVVMTLLPYAFSKLTKVYAYLDTRNQWLVLATANARKVEQFLTAFKKTLGDIINPFPISQLASMMTAWAKHHNYSSSFSIGKACMMQDANQQGRVIRCKEQDLRASNIQSFIQDGCEIKQLALNWQDRIDFTLLDNFTLQAIRFGDEIIAQIKEVEAGTKLQQFNADFLIMTESFTQLFTELLAMLNQPANVVSLAS